MNIYTDRIDPESTLNISPIPNGVLVDVWDGYDTETEIALTLEDARTLANELTQVADMVESLG